MQIQRVLSNKKLGTILFSVLLFSVLCQNTHSLAEEFYKRSEEYTSENCKPGFSADRFLGANPASLEKIRKRNLNQKGFGLCFGFAGFFLLQYNELESTGSELVLPDTLAQGCKKNFRELRKGGVSRDFLHQLRDKKLALENRNYPFDYEKMFKGIQKVDPHHCQDNAEAVSDAIKETYDQCAKVSEYYDYLSEGKFKPQSQKTFQYEIFDQFPGIEKVEPHPYNVQFEEAESEDGLIKSVRSHFQESRDPIVLSFCPEADPSGKCSGGTHAVVISGVRRAKCGNSYKEEWEIDNSYGSDSVHQGWHQASLLAKSAFKYNGAITKAPRCRRMGERGVLPLCEPGIQGKYPVHYLVSAKDHEGLRQVLKEHPEKINERNSLGLTPLQSAILSRNRKAAAILIQMGADVNLPLKGTPIATPVFIAVQQNDVPTFGLLVKAGAKAVFSELKALGQDKEKMPDLLKTIEEEKEARLIMSIGDFSRLNFVLKAFRKLARLNEIEGTFPGPGKEDWEALREWIKTHPPRPDIDYQQFESFVLEGQLDRLERLRDGILVSVAERERKETLASATKREWKEILASATKGERKEILASATERERKEILKDLVVADTESFMESFMESFEDLIDTRRHFQLVQERGLSLAEGFRFLAKTFGGDQWRGNRKTGFLLDSLGLLVDYESNEGFILSQIIAKKKYSEIEAPPRDQGKLEKPLPLPTLFHAVYVRNDALVEDILAEMRKKGDFSPEELLKSKVSLNFLPSMKNSYTTLEDLWMRRYYMKPVKIREVLRGVTSIR